MKKFLMLIFAGVMSMIVTVNAEAWCITKIIKVTDPKIDILVTNIVTGKKTLVINAYPEDSRQITNFFRVSNVDDLVDMCHQEGEDWNRAPLVIKIIDQAILLMFKPVQKKDSI